MSEAVETPTTGSQEAEAEPRKSLSLLASEMFGSDYKGTAEPERTDPEPQPVEAEIQETQEIESPEPPTGDVEETTDNHISSVSELIEHLEADPEWFNSLKVPVKVDGAVSDATLGDLVKSYQMTSAAEKRLEEAKSKAQNLNQEIAQKSEALQGQYASAASLIQAAEALLTKDISDADLATLRKDNPEQYLLQKEAFTERRAAIETLKRQAVEQFQQVAAQLQSQSAPTPEILEQEYNFLLEKLPDWRDQEKAATGKAKLVEYLTSQGFTNDDVLGASDHRLIVMAEKARLYDETISRVDAGKRKVEKVPKVMKPGAPKSPDQVNKERVSNARIKLRQSGSIDDAVALLRAKRGG